MNVRRQLGALFLFLGMGLRPRIPAQDTEKAPEPKKNAVVEGIESSFSFPLLAQLREEGGPWATFRREMSLTFGIDNPLLPAKAPLGSGLGPEGDPGVNSSNVYATIKDNPVSFWYGQITFLKYFRPELKRPWNPDFTYSFGYDDWHPYTFSLTYANYNGNRIFPNRSKNEYVTNLGQGGLTFGWKFNLPKKVEAPFLLGKESSLGWSVAYSGDPRYLDLASASTRSWKQQATFSCRNNVYKWVYWNITAFYYPHPRQQQPWDPDFTYGLGYFDYRPQKISVEYNNYAGNRYPWRNQGPTAGKIRSGSISIFWSPK